MERGSFQEFLNFLRVQDTLKAQGFKPVGWTHGFLLWSRTEEGSVTTVRKDVPLERVRPLDDVNALLV